MRLSIILKALLLSALGAWLSAWPGARAAETTVTTMRPTYVVTINPLAAIVSAVAGQRANVIRLLPPNASPHTYEPKPADAVAVSRALALIYASPHLDGWAAKLPAGQKIELVALLPASARQPMPAHHDEPAAEHDHDHDHDADAAGQGVTDPHFWTDPATVRQLLPALVKRLGELDPAGQSAYAAGAKAFDAELAALDAELALTLAPVRGRAVMLFHPSFCYLLKRYGLVYAGAIEPAPGKEATPRYLQQVIGLLRERQVKAVFTEPQLPARPAEVVAEAAGLPLRELDPNGGRPGRDSYAEVLRYNARTLAEALR